MNVRPKVRSSNCNVAKSGGRFGDVQEGSEVGWVLGGETKNLVNKLCWEAVYWRGFRVSRLYLRGISNGQRRRLSCGQLEHGKVLSWKVTVTEAAAFVKLVRKNLGRESARETKAAQLRVVATGQNTNFLMFLSLESCYTLRVLLGFIYKAKMQTEIITFLLSSHPLRRSHHSLGPGSPGDHNPPLSFCL